MAEKRNKRIVVQTTQEESKQIKEAAKKANMTMSEYVRTAALGDGKVVLVNKSGEIIGYLANISTEIQDLERRFPQTIDSLGNIKEEVMGLWRTLKS